MHIPSAFSVTDSVRLQDFIRKHSFAILASMDDAEDRAPIATHLPLLLECDDGKPSRLLGHVAKGNPQWRQADQRKVLAIFSGPHAYVSAAWYGEKNVVPTWNYVAVHVTGRLRIEQDPEKLMSLVQKTVFFYEREAINPWSMETSDGEYQKNLLGGIVGFEIVIESIEGCWKLNQHHSESRRNGALAGLRQRNIGDDLEIARLMAEAYEIPQSQI